MYACVCVCICVSLCELVGPVGMVPGHVDWGRPRKAGGGLGGGPWIMNVPQLLSGQHRLGWMRRKLLK